MPRIVPLQLLKCLKVLLDDNGGILSAGEVKRIAGLMTKYSKKLVSKCIYVQILKCTKTELLGEFMGVGGWSLVYTWLNDAIRAMNWPLVQEILELLLLSPVDVHRLKINSAPKLVKGLCKDGGNEGVRILAKRLVEQWLKVVTENSDSVASPSQTAAPVTIASMIPNIPQTSATATTAASATPHVQDSLISSTKPAASAVPKNIEPEVEQDPLADVSDVPPAPTSYTLTPAQKKANEAGLVYKIVVKDGQQVLAKVPKPVSTYAQDEEEEDEEEENVTNNAAEDDEVDNVDAEEGKSDAVIAETKNTGAAAVAEEISHDKETAVIPEKESESSEEDEKMTEASTKVTKTNENVSVVESRKLSVESSSEKNERKSSRRDSKDAKDRKNEKEKDKDKDRKSSSSSHKSSSSGHKSSSSKNTSSGSSSSSSSSSKSKSSSHRSSSDKHRGEKDRSSSSSGRDKERKEGGSSSIGSSSSSKHRSSSSSSSKTPSSSSSTATSSSSSKDRRDKEKSTSSSSSSSSSKKDREREKEAQSEKDKDTLAKLTSPSLDKLGKIPRKSKEDGSADSDSTNRPTSITIPSKKASISIEIRRDSEKAKTVKTYKSQFRSHGLQEEAPPPPSRKGLKKPGSSTSAPGTIIPTSLPSSLKRVSPPPPPRDSPTEKKAKIDINNLSIANEKPGAIKLIPPKKIQTLVETNIFSDALSAATGPKKTIKRKRPVTPAPGQPKEGPSPPTSPEAPKVAPLKFYQDTLDESKSEEKSEKDNAVASASESNDNNDDASADKENVTEDDDDIPLKKVKEDIDMKVLKEKKAAEDDAIVINSDGDEEKKDDAGGAAATDSATAGDSDEKEVRKPGPGCGPNGPPGVLMVHRRKGPKKKLSWRPQEQLEQIRYFEVDETERVNVTKTSSFMDMKNMERFSERDAISMSRRGFNHEDNMEIQTEWRPLIEVDDVPPHPDGNQSKQRKVQADRELTTLRALYFSHAMIPDSPAEAELEPHFAHDIPVIPLDDITGNPDAVNDFTSMPWPEPKGSPKHGDNSLAGTGGLSGLGGSPADMFGNASPVIAGNAFSPFMSPFGATPTNGPLQHQPQMPMQLQQNGGPQGPWPGPTNNGGMGGPSNQMSGGNPYGGNPSMDMVSGAMGPAGPMGGGGGGVGGPPPQNFMAPHGQYGPGGPQFMNNGPQFGPSSFNGPNFGGMGPGHPLGPVPLMNSMPPGSMMNGPGGNNRNNNGGNWRTGGSSFHDNSGGGNRSGNWRPAGSGPNRNMGAGNNNGVCKAYQRGHCRLGKSCKYIHPKSKRI